LAEYDDIIRGPPFTALPRDPNRKSTIDRLPRLISQQVIFYGRCDSGFWWKPYLHHLKFLEIPAIFSQNNQSEENKKILELNASKVSFS